MFVVYTFIFEIFLQNQFLLWLKKSEFIRFIQIRNEWRDRTFNIKSVK